MSDLIYHLSQLREKGVLQDIDIELCRFLKEEQEEQSGQVLLAACLTSYAYRQGDVCFLLRRYAGQSVFDDSELVAPALEEWVKALKKSKVIGKPGDFKPLILDSSQRLYLHKFWYYEQTLAESILEKAHSKREITDFDLLQEGLDRLFGNAEKEVNWQKVAAVASVINKFTVISGGPGTGKTTTVVRVLAILLEQWQKKGSKEPSIALAAPTGKAAARLEESVIASKDSLDVNESIKNAIPGKAVTIHQLLGARRNTARLRYDEKNPLPYDVVIIDEASMIDQALMSKLMAALLQDTKLILIGDKDQLASVEAGSVLGSICAIDHNSISRSFLEMLEKLSMKVPTGNIEDTPKPLTDRMIQLEKSYRFGEKSGIPQLATLINTGESENALTELRSGSYEGIHFTSFSSSQNFDSLLKNIVLDYYKQVIAAQDPEHMFSLLKRFRVLSSHRRGPLGVDYLNRRVEEIFANEGLMTLYDKWYNGKPVIINRNEYSLGLNNGDIGVCYKNDEGETYIYFQQGEDLKRIAPSRLPDHDTAFAMTVHKSQGSEFENVLFVLPNRASRILSRELIYTAITRARESVSIIGDKEILKEGIDTRLQRSSGLKDLLWKE